VSARRWAAGAALLGLLPAAAPSGCGQQVGLGPGRSAGQGGGPVTFGAACVSCGDECVLAGDAPGRCDPSLVCVGTEVTCAPECAADCPSPACANQLCGAVCDPCPAEDATCPPPTELFVCDAASACRAATEVECEPCAALAQEQKKCGEPCDPFCQPWDADCRPAADAYVCGADGDCVQPAQLSQCSPGYEPCGPDAACGQPCSVCDPLDVARCAVTPNLFCTGPNGLCTDQPVACEETACDGLPCGAQCGFCWPSDIGCQQKFCDGNGACMPAPLDVDCAGANPCDAKGCGEACDLCDPSLGGACDAQQLFLVCSVDGCGDATDYDSCYAPCAGKACGEWCADDCDPLSDPGCAPSVYKTCDAGGSCVENATPCF
jgi:hypothetical protein